MTKTGRLTAFKDWIVGSVYVMLSYSVDPLDTQEDWTCIAVDRDTKEVTLKTNIGNTWYKYSLMGKKPYFVSVGKERVFEQWQWQGRFKRLG